jgi:hypothetical protein
LADGLVDRDSQRDIIQVTVLSVGVEPVLALPAASVAAPAVEAMTDRRRHPGDGDVVGRPGPVPCGLSAARGAARERHVAVALATASLNTTVKLMGLALVGSACAAARLIVTVGATLSQVTVLSVEVEATLPLPEGRKLRPPRRRRPRSPMTSCP